MTAAAPRLPVVPPARLSLAAGALAAAGLLVVGGLAAADGGYFPTAWNTAALGLAWVAALAVLLPSRPALGPPEIAFAAALAALVAWIALSATWSIDVPQTLLEVQRGLLYAMVAATLLLTLRRAQVPHLLAGILIAIVAATGFGLVDRLFPDGAVLSDPFAGYRLFAPLGYWNALGLFCALGALLALAFAAGGRSLAARAAAAAAVPPLTATLYLTFSRGAWLALAAGVVVALAVSPRRTVLAAALAAVAAPAALAVWVASRSPGLTNTGAGLDRATDDGARLAWVVVVCALAAAALAAAAGRWEQRLVPGERLRRRGGLAVLAVVGCAALGALAVAGGPVEVARDGWRAFAAEPPKAQADLNERLFQLSGTGRARLGDVALDQYAAHPVLGAGAGSYERYYTSSGEVGLVRDAHDLYLETLAELGPLGLALILAVVAIPLAAGLRARAHPLAPACTGACAAFAVHAAYDWDWEMPALMVTFLAVACALLALARRDDREVPLGTPARVAVVVPAVLVGAACLVLLQANRAASSAFDAALDGRWAVAESEARTAVRWTPWSSSARLVLGRAQGGQDQRAQARATLGEAIDRDPGNWELWFELARWSDGDARVRALDRAGALNPASPEVAEFRAGLAEIAGGTS